MIDTRNHLFDVAHLLLMESSEIDLGIIIWFLREESEGKEEQSSFENFITAIIY